nr:unnamed protein product [Callosobruchus analis]
MSCVKIVGYVLTSFYCRSSVGKGGVCIFVRDSLNYKIVNVSKFIVERTAEFCAVEVLPHKYLIICLYRSPNTNIQVFLEQFELLLFLNKKYSKAIILGDFNLHFNTEEVNKLNNIIIGHDIEITITDFTRVTSMSESCIDNVLTNLDKDSYQSIVLDPSISDHYGQCILIHTNTRKCNLHMSQFRPITKAGILEINRSLEFLDWGQFYSSHDVNFMASFLLDHLKSLVERHLPLKNIYNNESHFKWFNKDLRILRSKVSAAKTIADASKNPDFKTAYKKLYKEY